MRPAPRLLVAALFASGFSCGGSNADSIVIVTVKPAADMAPISQLRVSLLDLPEAGAAITDVELFPEKPSPAPLRFDASFALAIPRAREGQLSIGVEALDATLAPAARGAANVLIAIGQRVKVTIQLVTSPTGDAGAPDMPASEAGFPLSDDARSDGQGGPDAPAVDAGIGADTTSVPETDGERPRTGEGGSGGTMTDATIGDARRDGLATGGMGGRGGNGGAGGLGGDGGTGGNLIGDALFDVNSTGGNADALGGSGGVGDAGSDAAPSACTTDNDCPSYPRCRMQPTCVLETHLCSAPSQCSVCGNGLVEFGEECDDGNTMNGDHCSSTCKFEYCGDGIVQSYALAGLSLVYLARSCGIAVEQDIWVVLNKVEVIRGKVKKTCDCEPGIVTLPMTDPAFLALGNNGTNIVEVHTHAEISWAIVHYESPSGPGDLFFVDYGSNGAAQFRRPNLCTNGTQPGGEIAMGMDLAGGEQCDDGPKNGTPGDRCLANCAVK